MMSQKPNTTNRSGGPESKVTKTGDQSIQAAKYEFPYHYIPVSGKRLYLSRHWGFAASYMAALNLVADRLRPVAESVGAEWRHIDIGCGDGALVYHLMHVHGLDKGQIAGVDTDEQAIAWARMFNPTVNLHAGDLTELEGGYHSASLVEVMEHVPPDALPKFVASAAELLRPGGLMVITVPSVEKCLVKKHYQHFDFNSIASALRQHFDRLEVRGFARQDILTRFCFAVRMNAKARIDAPALNRIASRRLGRLHSNQRGCERLLVIGQRK